MSTDIQSILAISVVVVAAGFYVYSTFLKKKKSGCGSEGGCGCSSMPQKPSSSQKSSGSEK